MRLHLFGVVLLALAALAALAGVAGVGETLSGSLRIDLLGDSILRVRYAEGDEIPAPRGAGGRDALDLLIAELGPMGFGAEQIASNNTLLYPGQTDYRLQTASPSRNTGDNADLDDDGDIDETINTTWDALGD